MKTARMLSTLLIGTLLLGTLGTSAGCLLRVRPSASVAYEVDSEPPPPRRVYVEHRAGYVWVDGYWYWNGGQWVWYDGHWEGERQGHVWVQGTWVRHGSRNKWKPGYWQRGGGSARGTVIVRDRDRGHDDNRGPKVRDHRKKVKEHKEEKRDKDDDKGPKVRDHRRK